MLITPHKIAFPTNDRRVGNAISGTTWALAIVVALTLSACGEGSSSSPAEQREQIQQLIDEGDFQGALQNSGELLREHPTDPEQNRFHGRVLLKAGRGAAAEGAFRRAEDLGLPRSDILVDLGRALNLQGKYRETVKLLEMPAETSQQSSALLAVRGEAELQLSSYSQDRVIQTFFELYKALNRNLPGTVDAEKTNIWLDEMRTSRPVVEAAFRHFKCSEQPSLTLRPIETQTDRGSNDSRILRVGPTRRLKVPSEAAKEAQDGDTIEIDAGVYKDDVAKWTQNRLILRGVGGLAHLQSSGPTAEDKGIWVFTGNDNTVERIEFSGARSRHHNGSGIRLHGSGLTVRYSYFHDNEDGILGGYGENSDVLIEYSEFARNGYGDGFSHNIYIGQIGSFTLRYSYSHHSNKGHLVKSRAYSNYILYNRLSDEDTGNSSYVVDIPEGGRAYVIGNELHKGPMAHNPMIISFGAEKQDRVNQALYVVHNTFYNKYHKTIFVKNYTDADALLLNNLFAGARGVMLQGIGQIDGFLTEGLLGLTDPRAYDYSLSTDSPAIDAGVAIPVFEDMNLLPESEYVHSADARNRQIVWKPDIGAHEFCGL